MEISRNLKKRANDLGIRQVDLCNSMNVPKATMNGYFNGKREPDIRTLKRLAKALNTTVERLVEGPDDESLSPKKPPATHGEELSEKELECIMLYRSLPPELRERALAMLETVNDAYTAQKTPSNQDGSEEN